jgi:hypothetical protein
MARAVAVVLNLIVELNDFSSLSVVCLGFVVQPAAD